MDKCTVSPSSIPALGRLIPVLLSRLSDSKPNIIEGVETSLMCMALSNCIGLNPIKTYALKPMKNKRETKQRLKFIQRLLEEFEEDAVSVPRVMEFIKGNKNYHNVSTLMFSIY